MRFTYIAVADDKPYVTTNPNFLSRVMTKLPSFSRGGKTKKSKKGKLENGNKSNTLYIFQTCDDAIL